MEQQSNPGQRGSRHGGPQSNGRTAAFISRSSTTDSDTRCHVGSSLTLQVGPTPDRRGSLRMQLPRRRPTWTWNPGSTPSSPAGGPRLDFKSGLVGLGKDASAPTSTDRIASHQRTRSPSMAQLRRQEKTPGNRDLTPALSTSSDDSDAALIASPSPGCTGDYDTPSTGTIS